MVGLCCVLTVILVSIILAVTVNIVSNLLLFSEYLYLLQVRLLSRAGAGAGDTDSTYYPASDSVDTLVTVTTRHQSQHEASLSDLGPFCDLPSSFVRQKMANK